MDIKKQSMVSLKIYIFHEYRYHLLPHDQGSGNKNSEVENENGSKFHRC